MVSVQHPWQVLLRVLLQWGDLQEKGRHVEVRQVSKTRSTLLHERNADETSASNRRSQSARVGRPEPATGRSATFAAATVSRTQAVVWLPDHTADLPVL